MTRSGRRNRVALAVAAAALTIMAAVGLVRSRTARAAGPADASEAGDALQPAEEPEEGLPIAFLVLVFLLSAPWWLVGERPLPVPVRLPTSALTLVNPLLAAGALTLRRSGWSGLRALLARATDTHRVANSLWYLPALFLYPLIGLLSYAVMRLAGRPLPQPAIAWAMAPVYLAVFLLTGAAEELGWMGYALEPMQRRWGALRAAVALGVIWGVFHLVPDIQNGRPPGWILSQRLSGVAFRILIVWVYNNTGGSVFTAILFHATNNLAWAMFPNDGSHYDPLIGLLLTLPVVALVLARCDPATLTRWRPRPAH